MRVSAVVSLLCWTSIVLAMWAGLLGWIAWDLATGAALAAWLVVGIASALVAGRYGARR